MSVKRDSRAPSRKKTGKKAQPPLFDKYKLYSQAVQSPETDVEFLGQTYKELRGRKARILREDFCGTFALCSEWVKASKDHVAYGVDIDPEPVDYGKRNYFSKLTTAQQARLNIIQGNVIEVQPPRADIIVAVNFSYFIFKCRELMKSYFANVYRGLKNDGIFICDIFGGTQCADAIEDVHKHKKFTYYWDQKGFDPISNEAQFYIHFKVGGKKVEKVFSYDWRMWSIPELREILKEVGFKKTSIYWEGTSRTGSGNGIFTRTERGESCDSWIAYIAAEK